MRFLQKSIAPQWKTWFTTQVYHLFWFILSKSQIRHRFTTYIHSECRLYLILVTQTGRFITFKTNFYRQYFAQLKQSFRAADPLRGTIVSIEQTCTIKCRRQNLNSKFKMKNRNVNTNSKLDVKIIINWKGFPLDVFWYLIFKIFLFLESFVQNRSMRAWDDILARRNMRFFQIDYQRQ